VRPVLAALALLAILLAAACGEDETAAAPPPVALTQDAIGHYCGMALVEHDGPKGQILLRGSDRPVWFSSARDTIAFTMLSEESKAIRAVYVSDMAKAESWTQPGATNWVEARSAHFVLGSDRRGGMGAEEAVPFSDKAAAERFSAEHGGRVLAFAEVPRDWTLGDGGTAPRAPGQPAAPPGASPRHAH
jgi:copper chaperone NosL